MYKFPDSRLLIPKFPGFLTSRFLGFPDSRIPGFSVSRIPGFSVSRIPGFSVSRFSDDINCLIYVYILFDVYIYMDYMWIIFCLYVGA